MKPQKALSFVNLELLKHKKKNNQTTNQINPRVKMVEMASLEEVKTVEAKKQCLFIGYACIICSLVLHFIWLSMWERKKDPSLDEIIPA